MLAGSYTLPVDHRKVPLGMYKLAEYIRNGVYLHTNQEYMRTVTYNIYCMYLNHFRWI